MSSNSRVYPGDGVSCWSENTHWLFPLFSKNLSKTRSSDSSVQILPAITSLIVTAQCLWTLGGQHITSLGKFWRIMRPLETWPWANGKCKIRKPVSVHCGNSLEWLAKIITLLWVYILSQYDESKVSSTYSALGQPSILSESNPLASNSEFVFPCSVKNSWIEKWLNSTRSVSSFHSAKWWQAYKTSSTSVVSGYFGAGL